ncbi:hypothetical protein [Massilia genomosp. 1]|uniref:Uncharacterized protein n=1 Tax=Massilia genomosp. 1 TaxID=2609280 RepID=A0ABX0MMV8_9BURK|nr:hypothetical protein [Massilia genomosp. 1]NHZ64081.1 hypothetical protein [Massilia genomosp. 1]
MRKKVRLLADDILIKTGKDRAARPFIVETAEGELQALGTDASYSYTDARVTRDTNPKLVGRKNGQVPAHKAALWLNARNLFDKKHLGNCSDGDCYPGDRRDVHATANYRW